MMQILNDLLTLFPTSNMLSRSKSSELFDLPFVAEEQRGIIRTNENFTQSNHEIFLLRQVVLKTFIYIQHFVQQVSIAFNIMLFPLLSINVKLRSISFSESCFINLRDRHG